MKKRITNFLHKENKEVSHYEVLKDQLRMYMKVCDITKGLLVTVNDEGKPIEIVTVSQMKEGILYKKSSSYAKRGNR